MSRIKSIALIIWFEIFTVYAGIYMYWQKKGDQDYYIIYLLTTDYIKKEI